MLQRFCLWSATLLLIAGGWLTSGVGSDRGPRSR
jgi:hypothetical protein